ncbi:unnamed protein product, partial [Symbiodinium necroappetens]
EVKWGNSYDSGKPKGPGCWSCIVAALRLWPHLEFEEVCDLCAKDAKSADEIARAKDLLAKQEENPFQPMSTVESNRVQGHEVYFKVAFLSESEMIKFLQVTPKALKLTEVTLELQQEGCTMRGYCVSLLDLPGDVKAVCHKVKIFSSTTIKLADTFLSPADQLSQHQGERTFTHLAKVQASRNPPAFRPLQKSSIPSYWDLKDKAVKLLEKAREQQPPSDDSDVEVYEPDEDEPVAAASKPELRLGAALAKDAISTRKSGKSKPGAAAKIKKEAPIPDASPERSRSPASKKESSSGPVNDLEDLDEEMAKVNARAGGGKTCLRSLVITRHLAGEKLGVRLAAVGSSVSE